MLDVRVQRGERPFTGRPHEAVPHRVGVDVIDVSLQLRFIVQPPFVEVAPELRPSDHPPKECLHEVPPRGASSVARGQREDAMQMIGKDHGGGQRERIAVAACAEREPQHVHMLGQEARALVFERGGEEVVDGCGLTAAIGIPIGIHAALWRGGGAAV